MQVLKSVFSVGLLFTMAAALVLFTGGYGFSLADNEVLEEVEDKRKPDSAWICLGTDMPRSGNTMVFVHLVKDSFFSHWFSYSQIEETRALSVVSAEGRTEALEGKVGDLFLKGNATTSNFKNNKGMESPNVLSLKVRWKYFMGQRILQMDYFRMEYLGINHSYQVDSMLQMVEDWEGKGMDLLRPEI